MKTLFSFLLCLLLAIDAHSQALRIDSTRFYCNGNAVTFSEITDIIQTKDGGFFFTGVAAKPGGGILPSCPGTGRNPVMGKLDSLGNIEWIKNFCDTALWARTVCQTADGGYAIDGGNSPYSSFKLVRYDAQGNYLWQKNYGWGASGGSIQYITTPDNGFLLLGFATDRDSDVLVTYDYPPGGFPTIDWVLMKLDSLGNKQWVRTLGTSDAELNAQELVCDGKNYYLIGATTSKDHDCADVTGHPGVAVYTIKLDSVGNVLWSKAHGSAFVSKAIYDKRDNSILITGRTNNGGPEFAGIPTHGYDDIFLMKLDTAGNFKWGNLFGTSAGDGGHDLCLAPNNGYFVVGEINNFGIASGILLSVDSNGNQADMNVTNGTSGGGIYFTRIFPFLGTYGVFGLTGALYLSEGSGRNCMIDSTKGSAGFCFSTLKVISLDIRGTVGPQTVFTLSPNPTHESVEVRFEGQHPRGLLLVSNTDGKQVLQQRVGKNEESVSITTASWMPGTYLICWQPQGKPAQCQKLIVQ